MYNDDSTHAPHGSLNPRHESAGQTTDDDGWEYMVPPIGTVAFLPDGSTGHIERVVHTPRDTWFYVQPGGWFPEQSLIYGRRKLT